MDKRNIFPHFPLPSTRRINFYEFIILQETWAMGNEHATKKMPYLIKILAFFGFYFFCLQIRRDRMSVWVEIKIFIQFILLFTKNKNRRKFRYLGTHKCSHKLTNTKSNHRQQIFSFYLIRYTSTVLFGVLLLFLFFFAVLFRKNNFHLEIL